MQVYERLGLKPIINAAGETTRLGGVLMEQEVIDAMDEAAKQSVRMDELQAAASDIISKITGAEAGYVTSGTSAGLTLGIAACLTGLDVARMNGLPDTNGMPNEVLVDYHQRNGYDHAIRAAGAKIINVGMPQDLTPQSQVYTTKPWEFESAITERTVAIVYFYLSENEPPLEQIINIAKNYNLPLMVDASYQVPPLENFRKFISMGADLVAYSGAKGIGGPLNTGILCGRRDLIAAVALQHLDMAESSFETWNPPISLIPKEKLRGLPQQGIGRGMKVSKEAIVGLLTALQLLTEEKVAKNLERLRLLLEHIAARLQGIAGVETEIFEPFPKFHPMLMVRIDEEKSGRSPSEVSQRLKEGDPRIYVHEGFEDMLVISAVNLDEEQANILREYLYMAVTS